MPNSPRKSTKVGFASLLGLAMAAAPIVALPAQASPDGSGVVINEAYFNGGSSGAAFVNKFVELYNPTTAVLSLDGMSLQYRSATGTGDPTGVLELSGSIAAKGYYLVEGGSNAANGAALPTPDKSSGSLNFAGGGGTIILADQTGPLNPGVGPLADVPGVVDLLGYGSSKTFEGEAATAASVKTSVNRSTGVDSNNNSDDFTVADVVTPTNAAGDTASAPEPVTPPDPVDPADATTLTIAEIQGSGPASTHVDELVKTDGVVTAAYATGGFDGYYIQTPGTGGAVDLDTHAASDGIFVYSPTTMTKVAIGDHVEIIGTVAEYYGMTQVTVASEKDVTVLSDTVAAPAAAKVALPATEGQRETLEGMLVDPQGDFTVTDNYNTNMYAEVVLAAGDSPLVQPTVTARPSVDAYTAAMKANKAITVNLDDGASINFLPRGGGSNQNIPLPYISTDKPVRIGAAVTFEQPVIFDYRNDTWKFQPTTQLTVKNAATVQPVSFENTRTAAPEDVGGDIKLATFNVLNYFTTLGADLTGCTSYDDRAGKPVTDNRCSDNGPRGAWDQANLQRQQDKIVAALSAIDADVVGLEEIENSLSTRGGGTDRDAALSTLVDALNAKAGSSVWAFVPSPAKVPASEDVIRTAFIYKKANAELVGTSSILDVPAFSNARQPLEQKFKMKGDDDANAIIVIANHFKSKGSGSGTGNADALDGQGSSNADRVAQAKALVTFAGAQKTDTGLDRVFLIGDFNSYLMEDPMQVLAEAGYIDQGSTRTDEETYSYGGMIGSLDHVLASPEANKAVTGADIWNINSVESIALEYSRYNYNAVNFYEPNVYRSSDHDPMILGINMTPSTTVDLNLLNINDFHGRIDANTVKFAGTIEQLRAAYGDDNTLLGSAGDNIGASVFASSLQKDKPTIDVMNALGLESSVGNHEFDGGYEWLTGQIDDWTNWTYLGANVYKKGTKTPALPEYQVFQVNGVDVGVIGAVTEETPSLVTKAGIASLDFGDPVEAVNRVSKQLTDGDLTNGEADVVIAEYHEGAGQGTSEGGTLANQVAKGGAFADIVNKTSAAVDVIFTGHTHKAYSWDAPIPGDATHTRPVLQTGSYGDNIGQIVLKYDTTSDDVVSYTARNVPRTKTDDAALVAEYPRVAQVQTIVDAALAAAKVEGDKAVGSVTADITRAFIGGVEDRGAESTIGNLVADALVSTLKDPELGGAEIGVVNPGGLRADLLYGDDGVITFAEANAVLPFLNNLWTTTLTGAQFKTVLEQQWQRDKDGVELTSGRTFLNLGLSDNVTYTYDPTRAMNDRVTGIQIDGKPIDLKKDYRIGTFNFLAEGGDNFWEFQNGTDARDSGLIDRDGWMAYITANSPLSPAFDRRGVQVEGMPTSKLTPGDTVTLEVSKLDLTSLGSPANTELALTWTGSKQSLGTVPVTDGAATVTFTVPMDALSTGELVMTAKESGTTVRVAMSVDSLVSPPSDGGDTPGTGGDTPGTGGDTPGTGGDTPGTGGDTGTAGGGTGGLSSTGANVLPLVGLGGLLLLLGFGGMVVARRRRLGEPVE